jgi:hypothetical protein
MEKQKEMLGVLNYSITQSSLEQVTQDETRRAQGLRVRVRMRVKG